MNPVASKQLLWTPSVVSLCDQAMFGFCNRSRSPAILSPINVKLGGKVEVPPRAPLDGSSAFSYSEQPQEHFWPRIAHGRRIQKLRAEIKNQIAQREQGDPEDGAKTKVA